MNVDLKDFDRWISLIWNTALALAWSIRKNKECMKAVEVTIMPTSREYCSLWCKKSFAEAGARRACGCKTVTI